MTYLENILMGKCNLWRKRQGMFTWCSGELLLFVTSIQDLSFVYLVLFPVTLLYLNHQQQVMRWAEMRSNFNDPCGQTASLQQEKGRAKNLSFHLSVCYQENDENWCGFQIFFVCNNSSLYCYAQKYYVYSRIILSTKSVVFKTIW